jgi:hypothetical protein
VRHVQYDYAVYDYVDHDQTAREVIYTFHAVECVDETFSKRYVLGSTQMAVDVFALGRAHTLRTVVEACRWRRKWEEGRYHGAL